MPEKKMTPVQRKVLHYIKEEIAHHGAPPTYRAIAKFLGFQAVGTVQGHVKALIRKGYLENEPGQARGIRLPERQWAKSQSIPILGQVVAGDPLEADEILLGSLPIPAQMTHRKELFALRIHGDSMTGAGIFEGDLVVVRKQNTANHGDIVVALVDGETTVKRLAKTDRGIYLMPENSEYAPIPIRSAASVIQGKVISVQRYLEGGY